MDYSDSNFKNLKVNGRDFVKGEKIDPDICLNKNMLVAGDGISITVNDNGKVIISLDNGEITAG